MSLFQLMLKVAGKDNFEIDKRISTYYIIRLCWKYGWMLVRGRITAWGNRQIANNVFIGKDVKLIEKKHLTIGEKAKIQDSVKIDALSINGVNIGVGCVIGKGTVIECTGSLANVGSGIVIGSHSTFGNGCFFGAAGGITIGKDVVAGQFIRFHSENHNYDDLNRLIKDQGVSHKGIRVGDNCWIGSGAVFLDGASIGNGCVVAANAVVTKSFPDNAVIAGIPAKIIRMR